MPSSPFHLTPTQGGPVCTKKGHRQAGSSSPALQIAREKAPVPSRPPAIGPEPPLPLPGPDLGPLAELGRPSQWCIGWKQVPNPTPVTHLFLFFCSYGYSFLNLLSFGNLYCLGKLSVSSGVSSVWSLPVFVSLMPQLRLSPVPVLAPLSGWAEVALFYLLILRNQLLDLLMGAPIFLVSNSLIRRYLHSPPASHGFTLLFYFPSLYRMFSSFIFSLSCSVIKTFKAVNSPPTPDTGSMDVQPLHLCGCKTACHGTCLLCDHGVT